MLEQSGILRANFLFRKIKLTIMKKNFKKPFRKSFLALLPLILFGFQSSIAQETVVTGTVSDAMGTPLPGANILVKGTTTGTQTDFDGNYSIEATENATLVFSYLGFTTKEISVDGKTTIDISLAEDASQLDEVVVIGYGTQRKSDLTGAVTSIDEDVLTKQPSLRVEDAIQGKAAGVQIQRTSGSPDGALRVRIRGTNSLQGNNAPLYVIDGVLGGTMSSLNVNDIESIEVLKDASATAIYGSQGSNGVILVTTKKAKAGKASWSFNAKTGFDSLIRETDYVATPVQFMQMSNLALPGAFSEDDISEFQNNPGLGTNWFDEVFRTGLNQDYQLSAQGGSENMRYYVSGTYNNIEAIVNNDDYERIGIRSNLNFNLSDKARITFNINASRIERGTSDVSIRDPFFYQPTAEIFDEFGEYTVPPSVGVTTVNNPAYSVNERKTEVVTNLLQSLIRLDLDLFKNVTYSFTGAAQTSNSNSSRFFRYIPGLAPSSSEARVVDSNFLSWQITNQLNYSKVFENDQSLTITAVQEMQKVTNRANAIEVSNFLSNALGANNLGLGGNSFAISDPNNNQAFQLASFLGRVNYSYKDRYLLTASMRADASSKFAEGNKWAYFPSAALAWKISSEKFLADSETIDLLKLRLSYGKVGSQAIDPYETLSNLEVPELGIPLADGSLNGAILLGDPANPDLKWETTAQYDIGFDLEMFNRRLTLGGDYYYKNTTDLLYARQVPLFAGTLSGTQVQNIGEMENRGIELLLSGDLIRKDDFTLNAAVNFSSNKNKFLGIDGIDEDILVTSEQYQSNSFAGIVPFILQKGQPLGNIQGLIYEGPYRTEDQALATQHGFDLGAPRFRDVNGDGQITVDDVSVIGNAAPDFIYGLNLAMNYKNVDFSMFIQGVQGNDILNLDRYQMTRGFTNNELLNGWSPQNENSNQWAYVTSSFDNPGNTQYVEDGSFIRLKNITLGYTIPTEVSSRFGIDSCRFYLNAQNIFTITDYTWLDPEASASGGRDQSQGVNLGAYPNPKSISLGLNLKL